ncbi:MAG: hypothetical protein QOF89_3077 [Acidobacteriota bacterium]|jgi:hypothetical protein|nr:hypothetical protein [Acidobacteriota bacterium]
MDHPSEQTLKRFVAGTASRDESRSVVAHLLKGCAVCAKKIRALMEPAAVRREIYDSPLERFNQRQVETLESSINPMQALRNELSRLLDEDRREPPGRNKGPRRPTRD